MLSIEDSRRTTRRTSRLRALNTSANIAADKGQAALLTKRAAPASPLSPRDDKENVRPRTVEPTAAKAQPASKVQKRSLKATTAVKGKPADVPASPYYSAKKALSRSTVPGRMVGRTKEHECITHFWTKHVHAACPGALYISGQPGTGKTALLAQVQREMASADAALSYSVHKVFINCMSLRDPKDIYTRLADELPSDDVGDEADQSDAIGMLRALLLNENRKMLAVVILDEVDHLLTRDQDVLYRLFEWAAQPTSRLVLIGIANALDLTERFLPRLRVKNCEPQLLNFNPYRVTDIVAILEERLREAASHVKSASAQPLIQRAAIELCARKVASATGDLRKAMDVCKQAVEFAEQEGGVKARRAESSPLAPLTVQQTPNTTAARPAVNITHVLKVLSGVFGSASVQTMRGLGIQQKLVLCAFFRMLETDRRRDVCIGQLHDAYFALCQAHKSVKPVTRSEFHDLIGMLESAGGLVSLGKQGAREDRARRIQLNVQPDEIRMAFREQPLLLRMLDKGATGVVRIVG
ncbi:P-loop containing nucleoside triphosphate hydrolase protein [Thamnocephalis sphaerospora]|uniref:Cell division control protein n=1 Tax=Thamnocephalis sphaerospora TaxID=78915 RepID=A0A4V1IX62_9FUNG|nr:P-loop containing nucleoside triphosphate hydrolase protein [Thamnocephalis sphaerospora]|eukprot:RKP09949.1 P-loop containing nucleoside triphosphate hydrolase protein [Thamnocephalis sphaerospora]